MRALCFMAGRGFAGGGMSNTPKTEKQFATLRAQFAMQGHTLLRTSPTDGAVTYYAQRWGLVRYLPTLVDVERFLAQIGGRP